MYYIDLHTKEQVLISCAFFCIHVIFIIQHSTQLGDPTAYGNLSPCPAIISAITQAVQCPNSTTAGYVNACGMSQAREAIAKYHSHQEENKAEGCTISHTHKVSMDDVIIANGASGALELALTALLDEDSVLLGM